MIFFALSSDPNASARLHCDAHVCKLIVESAQMLYTYLHFINVKIPPCRNAAGKTAYAPTHAHHPCVLWLHGGRSHFAWLLDLSLALCREYTLRFGKVHATQAILEHVAVQAPHIRLLDDCGPDAWLQRLADGGVPKLVLASCAAKVATVRPPNGCAFGVACIANDVVPLVCDAHGRTDLVATTLEYYAHKCYFSVKMRWHRVAEPPLALKTAWGWDWDMDCA